MVLHKESYCTAVASVQGVTKSPIVAAQIVVLGRQRERLYLPWVVQHALIATIYHVPPNGYVSWRAG